MPEEDSSTYGFLPKSVVLDKSEFLDPFVKFIFLKKNFSLLKIYPTDLSTKDRNTTS